MVYLFIHEEAHVNSPSSEMCTVSHFTGWILVLSKTPSVNDLAGVRRQTGKGIPPQTPEKVGVTGSELNKTQSANLKSPLTPHVEQLRETSTY